MAQTYSEIEHHKVLRHWLADYIITQSKSRSQSLRVSDYSVPEENYSEFFHYLISVGKEFENEISNTFAITSEEPGYTLFGHAGDCHPHLTLLPRNNDQAELADRLILDILSKTTSLGGSIASEHGLGKKQFDNKPALFMQYGESGIEIVKEMKKVLDPKMLLCPDNLIPKKISYTSINNS